MSLLLQALKRADAQKRQPIRAAELAQPEQAMHLQAPAMTLALEADEPAMADMPALSLPAEGLDAVVPEALPQPAAEPVSETVSTLRSESIHPAAPTPAMARTVAPSPALAKQVFAAKAPARGWRPSPLILLLLGVLVAVAAGIAMLMFDRPAAPTQPLIAAQPEAVVAVAASASMALIEPVVPASAVASAPLAPASPPARERIEMQAPAVVPARVEVRRSEAAEHLPVAIEAGFEAYQSGHWRDAEAQYRRALQQDSRSRDALLGLAAALAQQGRSAAAIDVYRRLAQLYPDDAAAQAGLVALQQGGGERQSAKLKQQADGGDADAAFVLGNRLSFEGRWPEAQAAYFQAFSQEPTSADYAYNLAVSLDRLQQPQLAADYYRRALSLAGGRSARFDAQVAKARLAALTELQ